MFGWMCSGGRKVVWCIVGGGVRCMGHEDRVTRVDVAGLDGYVESVMGVVDDSPQLDEANTKAAVLRDFIEVLGWEIPGNTELEFSVEALGKVHKVDYALKVGGQAVAFLEAKGLDNELTDDHRKKIKDYLRNENVELGILTNGREYEFYQLRLNNSGVPIELVEATCLEDLSEKQSIVEAYHVENIREEKSGEIIENIRRLRSDRDVLRENKDAIAGDVVEVITDLTSGAIEGEAETQAKEMVDELISHVESEVTDDRVDDTVEVSGDTGAVPDDTGAFSDDTYHVHLVNDGSTIRRFSSDIQTDLIVDVVEYLIENHDLISAIGPLPYVPGTKRPIIHHSQTHNGSEMYAPREICSEYYIELDFVWDEKKRRMNRITEFCDIECKMKRINGE